MKTNLMIQRKDPRAFDRLHTSVRQSDVSGKTLLIPEMAPTSSRLIAASFRAFGVNAVVMETYKGLGLGRKHTSGKECLPCQVTLGDVLLHLQGEKERLGSSFSPERYAYFMPEADGPCRFGMYNKLQRMVLDRFQEFEAVPIVYISTRNNYATAGILPPDHARLFRRLSYVSIIAGDVLDRITWRVRPYELRPGATDAFMAEALTKLATTIETVGASLDFAKIYSVLSDIAATAVTLMDPRKPRRPVIGIIGEIYLRSHPDSNQNIILQLEKSGAEVVDASLGEWINYITSESLKKLRRTWIGACRRRDRSELRAVIRQWIGLQIETYYQYWRQRQVYRCALRHLDIQSDHSISRIKKRLDGNRLFHEAIGTEAVLSIGGALEHAHHGLDGVVNVFPFTCMPSTMSSAILKPLLNDMNIPYLDAPYDGAMQPNRDVALRTFMYQAQQHQDARNAGRNGEMHS
jgi:predicted nucleotide-binding protein (sugar kinase/HSP70/actin superfamily)